MKTEEQASTASFSVKGQVVIPTWLPPSAAAMLLAVVAGWAMPVYGQDWTAHRGGPRRTGNLDDLAGPKDPEILWVYKAREHYVASPVPAGECVYVAGLGAFNTGVFHCMALKANAPARAIWSKGVPFIKRPTVSAPAVAGGLVVFGDGMHQTDDAVLFCLQADSGRSVWQLPVPGKLVHMEGAPVIDQGRVFIGAGAAGVLCAALQRVTLDGQEQDLATAQAAVEKRWTELKDRYEEQKKKNPDFAIPPSEDAVPKPAPKVLWQKGQGVWHVDAPLAVW